MKVRKLLFVGLLFATALVAASGTTIYVTNSSGQRVAYTASSSGTTIPTMSGAVSVGHVATYADTLGTLGDGGAPATVTSVQCGTGLTGGTITTTGTCAADFGTGSGKVAQGNDSRITGAEQAANKDAASGYAGLTAGGLLKAAEMPNPSSSTLGGVESIASVVHNVMTYIDTSGVPHQAQLACGDLSDAAASCATDATNAANIASGVLAAARLYPHYAFGSLPSCGSSSGVIALVTDIGSGGSLFECDGAKWRPLNGSVILASSAVAQSHTGDTSETALVTVTIPAGLMTANGSLRISSLWSTTSNTDSKVLRIRFGNGLSGTSFFGITITTTGSAVDQATTIIRNRNATNSQVGFQSNNAWGTGGSTAVTTAAIDTTSAQSITFTGQDSTSSSDTVTLEAYTVELVIP